MSPAPPPSPPVTLGDIHIVAWHCPVPVASLAAARGGPSVGAATRAPPAEPIPSQWEFRDLLFTMVLPVPMSSCPLLLSPPVTLQLSLQQLPEPPPMGHPLAQGATGTVPRCQRVGSSESPGR